MGFYDGDAVLTSDQRSWTVHLQINDTTHPHWEAVLDGEVSVVPGDMAPGPMTVAIADEGDRRDGWSAPAHWAEGNERPLLHGDDAFGPDRGRAGAGSEEEPHVMPVPPYDEQPSSTGVVLE
jgi:hypothetical protein